MFISKVVSNSLLIVCIHIDLDAGWNKIFVGMGLETPSNLIYNQFKKPKFQNKIHQIPPALLWKHYISARNA